MTPSNYVLAVDDDPDILLAFKDVLELEGHRVLLARGGREALELLRHGARPSVILLDLMMPDVNGWEFRDRQLADASLAPIPVVVISGQGVSAREVAALGVEDYLRKPVDVEQLLGAISRYVLAEQEHPQPV
ncbi:MULTISPECIES: response regulator [Myxococcus]|uniref:Response regulator n=1 Tax=Myxococcus llanfairpwllgwyngyllgogerychwyrndrobwllllantysiliogogogochensis TaxID=2590453 RepID=A0A540WYD6_9BACT|nr:MULTISPECIES: response regulator [Myxococcus]NTX00414.1 response regulator [Myxococcus sp. CA040A]NTX15911.1 response regulator [Myxococcus sp. CA056]NTX51800.1 response regulator [Myxococcus sp. CA039A]TQF13993.1 response regulator [Myxococcus llanfairpwllgwyngyllgogerychwyrndrobwllllantysiliogogogochensis]